MVVGVGGGRERKKEKKLADPEQSSFEPHCGRREDPIGPSGQKHILHPIKHTVKQAFPLKSITWVLSNDSVKRWTGNNHIPVFYYGGNQIPSE